jgi:hypothetical protein
MSEKTSEAESKRTVYLREVVNEISPQVQENTTRLGIPDPNKYLSLLYAEQLEPP